MDYNILLFFVALAIVLFILARLTHTAWLQLALGWIAGGIMLVIGYTIFKGETITSTAIIDTDVSVISVLNLGLSSENTAIIFVLLGVVMVFSSSGDWI